MPAGEIISHPACKLLFSKKNPADIPSLWILYTTFHDDLEQSAEHHLKSRQQLH